MANNDGKSSKRENLFPSRILRVLRDPVWQFVGTLMGVMGILATYHVISLQHDTKALQVMILARTSLVEVEQSVAEEITILYRDQTIADLSLFQVKVENSGTQTIREEDYAKPIKFVFPSQAEIVESAILESNPRNIGMTVQKEQNTATLSPTLLNEKDRVLVRFLVSNMPVRSDAQPFAVDARIAGVREVNVVNALEDRETPKGTSAILGYWAGFVAGILAAGVFGFVLQQLRFHRKRMDAFERPQVVIVTTKTEQTPEEVIRSSRVARLNYVFWAVVLTAMLLAVLWLAFRSLS